MPKRIDGELQWRDENMQGEFTLIDTPDGEFLRWDWPNDTVWWFSLNRVSFGHLQMSDEKSRHYAAIRTDGGQGLPRLEREGTRK